MQLLAGTTASCVCWHEGCSDGAVHWKLITIHYIVLFKRAERQEERLCECDARATGVPKNRNEADAGDVRR